MDRQLSVWAAPGLVFLVALIAMLSGHLPAGMVPSAGERPQPPAPAEPVEVASTGGVSLGSVTMPVRDEEPDDSSSTGSSGGDASSENDPESTPSESAEPAEPIVYDGPAGVVEGRIIFDGAVPKPGPLLSIPEADVAPCCADKMDRIPRGLLVSDAKGVADVVVVIKADDVEADGKGSEFVMDQICCRFEPHVLVVPQGATVKYTNSDGMNHNVHTYSKKNRELNNNVAAGSATRSVLEKDEQFKVGCDIHPWMKAQVFVTEYQTTAKTDADGNFRIEGVPPGEWKVEIWGENVSLPKRTKHKVLVQPDSTTTVEWTVEEK